MVLLIEGKLFGVVKITSRKVFVIDITKVIKFLRMVNQVTKEK